MTMTDTPTSPPPAAEPKRKIHRKAKRRAPPVAAKKEPSSPLAGITPTDCPNGCTSKQCVISMCGRCAHPMKGGLPAGMQNDLTLRRLAAAKRVLGEQKLDLTKI